MVGDDDQAIYGWRGATLDNLAALPRDSKALQVAVGYLPEAGGLFNRACTMMAANVYRDVFGAEVLPVGMGFAP